MIFGYSIIGAIIVGLILGVLAKFVMPGKQAVPIWLTILVGIVAAIIGNYVATLLRVRETFGFDWIRHGLQLRLRRPRDRRARRRVRQEDLIDRRDSRQRRSLRAPSSTNRRGAETGIPVMWSWTASPARSSTGAPALAGRRPDSTPCPNHLAAGVLVATERGRSRCCACSATRRGEATRVGPPGRVPRRSNRSGPGARPAGQIITEAGDAVDAYPQSGLRHILHRLRLDSARLIRLNLGDGGTRRRRRQWPRPRLWTTPVDNGTGCPHLRLETNLDTPIQTDSRTLRTALLGRTREPESDRAALAGVGSSSSLRPRNLARRPGARAQGRLIAAWLR